jgi:hypothetical protein
MTRRALPQSIKSTTMSAATYFLSKDCFVCKMGEYWIVLSASTDRYLCVAHGELKSIGCWIAGWNQSVGLTTPNAEASALISSLSSNGILTNDPALGKPFAESECLSPTDQLETFEAVAAPNVSLLSIVRFFWACGAVDWRLRRTAFARNLARIAARRQSAKSCNCVDSTASASRLIGIFKSLRPLYPRSYLCLFDSLALLEFLAGYHLCPNIVFGVVADPFQAHCWLQEGITVLNDDVERVRRYKPILSA